MGRSRGALELEPDGSLVACCGLYCGACGRHLKGRCPGCLENEKATWCKVKACCAEHGWRTCAECELHEDLRECSHLNGLMARFFALLFRSDRVACLEQVRTEGVDGHARLMAERGQQTIRRGSR